MKFRNVYYLLISTIIIISCKKDDDSVEFIPPTDISEIFVKDEMKLQEYFATHFYNYEEFETKEDGFDYKIKIDTIAGANSDKISLKDSENFGFKTLVVKSENVGIDGTEVIDHKVYYLIARQGLGASATFADSTYVKYEGTLLNGDVFDSSNVPVWFNLPGLVTGFAHGVTSLKAGNGYDDNGDGTFEVKDYGIGMIFIPSALGYYANVQGTIPAYSPIIFKIDLLAVNPTDHDSDGIPSYLEDIDGNGRLANDNSDFDIEESTTFNFIPNYLDADDDGDGTLTKEEIIINADGTLEFPDSDGDGIPNYLDKDTK
tara:strand:- start:10043 stop:10990 length:948 start_codon:yes stop_codon:yes gene_type:complete